MENEKTRWQFQLVGEIKRRFEPKRLLRKHGITLLVAVTIALYGWAVSAITAHNVRIETEERLAAEYDARLEAYKLEQQEARAAEYFLSGEASFETQLNKEADAIARVIGTMQTTRQKQTLIWNILVRVDSPYYPNSVQEVVAQPEQWIFYSESNPIREDDRQLALAQLRTWHEGKYPAGLKTTMVYGEWSQTDYVLRDNWEKTSSAEYWRYPE